MGRDAHFTCKTCKVDYYLGYTSYCGWNDDPDIKTVEEFDRAYVDDIEPFYGNVNYRNCLAEHQGHDWITWSSDWNSVNQNGHLMAEGHYSDEIYIPYFDTYKRINLDPSSEDDVMRV